MLAAAVSPARFLRCSESLRRTGLLRTGQGSTRFGACATWRSVMVAASFEPAPRSSKPQNTSLRAQSGGASGEEPRGYIQQMPVEDLKNLISNPEEVQETQFVDVREPWEYSTARLPHFELYPTSQVQQWGPTVHDELDADKHTVVLCHHGMRSQYIAEFLVSQGFKNVSNVIAGIEAYSMVDPSVPRY